MPPPPNDVPDKDRHEKGITAIEVSRHWFGGWSEDPCMVVCGVTLIHLGVSRWHLWECHLGSLTSAIRFFSSII